MEKRRLGKSGLEVSAIGLGCMGMSEFYGPTDEEMSLKTLHHALDVGVCFWDTSDMYGSGHNEALIGRALADRRDGAVVATKFGFLRDEGGGFLGVSGRPEYVQEACDKSLGRLGLETIDLYYQHRVDPEVPIEDTVGAMARLVEAGKVRYLGLSEAAAGTLERAARVHPIAALQSEYSLMSRDVEGEVLDTCRRLGIGFVAYSPLGRGFLSALRSLDDLAQDDWRRSMPRFEEERFGKNRELVERAAAVAAGKGVSLAQLCLAWLLHQGTDIVPIPGTRKPERLDEKVGAVSVELSAEDLAELESALSADEVSGARYPEAMMGLVNG